MNKTKVLEIFLEAGYPIDLKASGPAVWFGSEPKTLASYLDTAKDGEEWEYIIDSGTECCDPHWYFCDSCNTYHLLYVDIYPSIIKRGDEFIVCLNTATWDGSDWGYDCYMEINSFADWDNECERAIKDDSGERDYLEWVAETGEDPCKYFIDTGPESSVARNGYPESWDELTRKAWASVSHGRVENA